MFEKDKVDSIEEMDAATRREAENDEATQRENDNKREETDEREDTGYDDGGADSLENKVSNSVGRGAVESLIKNTVYEKYNIDAKAMKEFSRLSPTEMLSSFRDSVRELGTLRSDYSQGKISKDEYKALSGKVKGEISGKMLEMGSCRKSILEDILLRSFGVSPSEVSGAKTFSELVDVFKGDAEKSPDVETETVFEGEPDELIDMDALEQEAMSELDIDPEAVQEADLDQDALKDAESETDQDPDKEAENDSDKDTDQETESDSEKEEAEQDADTENDTEENLEGEENEETFYI